jgi:RNA polymerase sigma-70 factor (ECF subfamily)
MGAAPDFDRLIDTYRGPLIGLIASLGVSRGDAEELAQDTFAEAYVARERFNAAWHETERVGAWLRGIALNLARTWKRSRARRAADSIADHDPAAHVGRETDETERVMRALQRLPMSQRTVITMVYLEDSGIREVAALLGVKPKNVENELYRARRALKAMLATPSFAQGREGESS